MLRQWPCVLSSVSQHMGLCRSVVTHIICTGMQGFSCRDFCALWSLNIIPIYRKYI